MGKLYVRVVVYINEHGKLTPIQMKPGKNAEWVKIDRVKDCQRRASLKAGGVGMRHTCVIDHTDFYLFDEEGKWFIETDD